MAHKGYLAILLHRDPDLDAIGSALLERDYALNECKYKEAIIVGKLEYGYSWLIEDKDICEDIPKNWTKWHACVVDTKEPTNLSAKQKKILKGASAVSIYDHHIPCKEIWSEFIGDEAALNYTCRPEFDSCCEIIWGMMDENEIKKVSQMTLTAILAGIYAESNSFRDCKAETFKTVAKLIELGGNMELVIKNANRRSSTLFKWEYLAKVISNSETRKESGIVMLFSKYSEYLKHNPFAFGKTSSKRAPIYILSLLRRENVRVKKNTNAYALVCHLEDRSHKNVSIIIDLLRWSPTRQALLGELGFKLYKAKQYRYYLRVAAEEINGMWAKIEQVFISTNTEDLEYL